MGSVRSISSEIGAGHLSNGGNIHVQGVVKAAHEELTQLIRQRADIMKRIGTLKQTILGLANLFGDEVLGDDLQQIMDRKTNGRQPGFTKLCRSVLMEAGQPLSAREVCQRLQEHNPEIMLRHKDPLASVTTVLNRLAEYGEAQIIVRDNGRRSWLWVSEKAENDLASVHYDSPVLA